MKKAILLTVAACQLTSGAFANTCQGTGLEAINAKISSELKAAKSGLSFAEEEIESNKSLRVGARVYATARTIAIGATVVVPSFVGGAAVGLGMGLFRGGVGAGAIGDGLMNVAVGGVAGTVFGVGMFGASNFLPSTIINLGLNDELDSNSELKLISKIEDDINSFKKAHTEISVTHAKYEEAYTEDGKNLSWDDVGYLNVQIEANEAHKNVYETEIVYYQTLSRSLNESCKLN